MHPGGETGILTMTPFRLPDFSFIKPANTRGFSLVEISIVLIIIGMILSMGLGMMKSLTRTSSVKKVKNDMEIAENVLYAFATSRGRLPCPDTDGDGRENCPVSNCSSPPCGLPFLDIGTDNADAWAQPFYYDVTDILTTTTQQNQCVVLYELLNFYSWAGSPANSPCGGYSMVCATNTSDTDNGAIASSVSGSYLAAIIISGGEDAVLGGKDTHDARREYERASNPWDFNTGRNDIVREVPLGRLFSKICTSQGLRINVTGADTDGDGIVANYSIDHGPCTALSAGQPLAVFSGQQVAFFPDSETTCPAGAPKLVVDFYDGAHNSSCSPGSDMIDCDTSGSAWNGRISIDGNSNSSAPVMSDS